MGGGADDAPGPALPPGSLNARNTFQRPGLPRHGTFRIGAMCNHRMIAGLPPWLDRIATLLRYDGHAIGSGSCQVAIDALRSPAWRWTCAEMCAWSSSASFVS